MARINWKASTKEEVRTINAIAHRAVKHAALRGIEYSVMDADMDLTATHLNGCPLRLEELLAADDFNFDHDVFGIRRHMNRETGRLENCFLPRFARR